MSHVWSCSAEPVTLTPNWSQCLFLSLHGSMNCDCWVAFFFFPFQDMLLMCNGKILHRERWPWFTVFITVTFTDTMLVPLSQLDLPSSEKDDTKDQDEGNFDQSTESLRRSQTYKHVISYFHLTVIKYQCLHRVLGYCPHYFRITFIQVTAEYQFQKRWMSWIFWWLCPLTEVLWCQ